MNNQFCTKPNVQMFLLWLFVHLCRNGFRAGNGARVLVTNKNKKDLNDFVEPFQLTVHQLRMAVRFALAQRIVSSFSVAHNGYSSLRLRLILFTVSLQQTCAIRKNQASSHLAIHRLIHFFHVRILNIKSIIHQQLVIQSTVLPVEKE
ncbi:hypothetical protein [Sporolactobacillus nakayamae]|uniref:Uncharacterized protein n=1 Tax=Sporolactobacillus nakayamae TaxID=269670 RepID=A0A1I2PQD2_9BACL|nr:hypothetical protein [Sporolactobacillus nakayamae]SFG17309.1 hypothetical protein SAMN02982927_00895 [Sporolactobacillus nakayamae]